MERKELGGKIGWEGEEGRRGMEKGEGRVFKKL